MGAREAGNGSPGSLTGAGAILHLIRDGKATTRAELAQITGLARSTVSQRVESLLARRLVIPAAESVSTGGRPPTVLVFNAEAGAVLAADLGATHSRLAVADLGGTIVAESTHDVAIADGPETVLPWLAERCEELLVEARLTAADVRAIGVGVPGPVEFATGTPVSPPIMPGWDGYPVAGWLAERFGVPALVDNDVNVIALGEHSQQWPDVGHVAVVKVATGIGMGLVTDGRIYRGAQGSAGDIGHIQVTTDPAVVCSCGNSGCLEAVAGGGALAARLSAAGVPAANARAVVELVRRGNPEATRLVREAGREIGGVLAAVVNIVNPAVVVVTGDLADAGEHLLAGVRETIYRRSTALATHSLRIVRSTTGDRGGVIGAAVLALEHVLAPNAIDDATRTPR